MKKNDSYTVKISFGKSTSKSYKQAVVLAKCFDSYECDDEENTITHSVSESISVSTPDKMVQMLKDLHDTVFGWRSSNISVSGFSESYFQLYEMLMSVSDCQRLRDDNSLGDDYCRGLETPADSTTSFGCRFVSGVSLKPTYASGNRAWWEFARDKGDGKTFSVDKKLMAKSAEVSIEHHACKQCKYFNFDRVVSDIDLLPDTVISGDESKLYATKIGDPGSNRSKLTVHKPYVPRKQRILDDSDSASEQVKSAESTPNRPSLKLCDVAINIGTMDVITQSVINPIRHPEYFEALEAPFGRGIILHGPPGNGKTLLAESIAGETGSHFEKIDGPEVLSKWIGQSEENIRNAFARARNFQPSILFIDELDSIAPSRSQDMQQHNNQIVAQLLTLLDDKSSSMTWVIGSTNRIESIDPAIRRPGRFDHTIFIGNPDATAIEKILSLHLCEKTLCKDVCIQSMASLLIGMSGAEVASICHAAQSNAIQNAIVSKLSPDELVLKNNDFDVAISKWKKSNSPT